MFSSKQASRKTSRSERLKNQELFDTRLRLKIEALQNRINTEIKAPTSRNQILRLIFNLNTSLISAQTEHDVYELVYSFFKMLRDMATTLFKRRKRTDLALLIQTAAEDAEQDVEHMLVVVKTEQEVQRSNNNLVVNIESKSQSQLANKLLQVLNSHDTCPSMDDPHQNASWALDWMKTAKRIANSIDLNSSYSHGSHQDMSILKLLFEFHSSSDAMECMYRSILKSNFFAPGSRQRRRHFDSKQASQVILDFYNDLLHVEAGQLVEHQKNGIKILFVVREAIQRIERVIPRIKPYTRAPIDRIERQLSGFQHHLTLNESVLNQSAQSLFRGDDSDEDDLYGDEPGSEVIRELERDIEKTFLGFRSSREFRGKRTWGRRLNYRKLYQGMMQSDDEEDFAALDDEYAGPRGYDYIVETIKEKKDELLKDIDHIERDIHVLEYAIKSLGMLNRNRRGGSRRRRGRLFDQFDQIDDLKKRIKSHIEKLREQLDHLQDRLQGMEYLGESLKSFNDEYESAVKHFEATTRKIENRNSNMGHDRQLKTLNKRMTKTIRSLEQQLKQIKAKVRIKNFRAEEIDNDSVFQELKILHDVIDDNIRTWEVILNYHTDFTSEVDKLKKLTRDLDRNHGEIDLRRTKRDMEKEIRDLEREYEQKVKMSTVSLSSENSNTELIDMIKRKTTAATKKFNAWKTKIVDPISTKNDTELKQLVDSEQIDRTPNLTQLQDKFSKLTVSSGRGNALSIHQNVNQLQPNQDIKDRVNGLNEQNKRLYNFIKNKKFDDYKVDEGMANSYMTGRKIEKDESIDNRLIPFISGPGICGDKGGISGIFQMKFSSYWNYYESLYRFIVSLIFLIERGQNELTILDIIVALASYKDSNRGSYLLSCIYPNLSSSEKNIFNKSIWDKIMIYEHDYVLEAIRLMEFYPQNTSPGLLVWDLINRLRISLDSHAKKDESQKELQQKLNTMLSMFKIYKDGNTEYTFDSLQTGVAYKFKGINGQFDQRLYTLYKSLDEDFMTARLPYIKQPFYIQFDNSYKESSQYLRIGGVQDN